MFGIVLVILFLTAGIILLSANTSIHKQTREQFLQSLGKFVDGHLESIKDSPRAFRIRFVFEGRNFIYEDIPEMGFKQEHYKAYLKVKTDSDLTLQFSEKPRSTTIKSEVLIVSNIPDEPLPSVVRVSVPARLKDLNIHTNNPKEANRFLGNEKIVSILAEFKNVDSRGYPSVSLKIIDGMVILEFHSSPGKNPSRHALGNNIASMEDHLVKLLKIVNQLKAEEPDID